MHLHPQELFKESFAGLPDVLMKQVSGHWNVVTDAYMECRSLVEAGAGLEFFKGKGEPSMALRDKIAELDCAEQLSCMMKGATTIGDIEVIRVEYMSRYTKLSALTCKLGQSGQSIPGNFEVHVAIAAEAQSLTDFLKFTIRDKWGSIEQASHFKAKLEDGRNLVAWATAALTTARVLYTEIIDAKTLELESICPPEDKVNDAEMLTNTTVQAFLFRNPKRDKLNPQLQELQDILQLLKKAQSAGYKVVKQLKCSYNRAMEMRARAKTAMMVDWTLDNILHDPKQSAGELKEQAESIREMLNRTNVTLPSYLDELLSRMSGEALA